MPFANVGGEKIYYTQQGQQGIPVVFVHGAARSHLIWNMQTRALGAVARAVALDLPGHGKSQGAGRSTVDAFRDVVLGLLDALGFDRAIIVGHSMGGAIAQTLALSHPDRVAGLGLVCTGARLRVLPVILDGVLSPSDFDNIARMVTEYSFAPDADASLCQLAEEQFRVCPASLTHGDFSACDKFDVMTRIAEIRAPVLVICGREDRMTPVKYSEFFKSKMPQARLVLIEGAGHSVMVEKPDEVNHALVGFVTTQSP